MKSKIKNKVGKNKTKIPLKDEAGYDMSLIEEEKNRCLIMFPEPEYAKDTLDGDLGLIGVLVKNKIMFNEVYYKEGYGLIFEYDKKYTNKIKDIEYKYFMHNIQIDAKGMSDLTMFVVNYLGEGNWRQKLRKGPRRAK